MTTLIGTNPDQIPVNSMLGGMAYQDPDSINVKDLNSSGTANIASLVSPAANITNLSYSGTLTGGTGVINIGSNQIYKDASGNIGLGAVPISNGKTLTLVNTTTNPSSFYLQNSITGFTTTDGTMLQLSGSATYLWNFENSTLSLGTNNTEYVKLTSTGDLLNLGTGATKLPEGTTAQRPASPQEGMIRKNSSTGRIETFLRSTWRNMPEDEQGINLIDNSIFSVTNRPFTVARTSVSSFVMDRWYWRATNASASTSLSNTAFNDTSVYGYGLTFTNNAVVSSIPADSICCLRQTVVSHVSGVSKLKTGYMTLSFLVRGSTPGTYSLCIQSGLNEVYTTTYSVASSSSFNRVSITFPTPTLLTNVLIINFNIGTGADNQTAALNSWIASSTPKFATTGINLISQATNSTLTFAEVKLEFGDVATSFVMKDYVTDLHNCMRHYQNSYNNGISPGSTASYGGAIMASPSATTNYASFGSVRFNPPLEEGFLNSFVTYNPETGATGSARNTTTNTNVSVSTHFAGDKGANIRVNNVSVTGGNLLAIHWEADTGY